MVRGLQTGRQGIGGGRAFRGGPVGAFQIVATCTTRSLQLSVLMLFGLFGAAVAVALPLAPYPHTHPMYNSSAVKDDYVLALGAMEKINNRWVTEREQRISGKLEKTTFTIDEGHTPNEVFEYYTQQLRQLSGRELFSCRGRTCGSSNSWANNHFQVKQLYGLDDRQRYSVFEVEMQSGLRAYVSLYAVTRGNKRGYLQLDVMTSKQRLDVHSSAEVILESLRDGHSFKLPGIQWQSGAPVLAEAHLKSLKDAIRRQRGSQFVIVGHDFGRGEEQERQRRSLAYAEAIKAQLQSVGISEQRLLVFGVGSLAPAEKGKSTASRMVTLLRALN